MKQLIVVVVTLLTFSAVASAQAPTPTGKMPSSGSEFGKNEIFGAFLYEPTDYWCYQCVGAHGLSAKGVEFSYTRYFGNYFGAIADMDYAKNSDEIELSNFGYRFGVRGNLLRRERMIVPFGHVLVGGGHASYYSSPSLTANGFSWAFGGGVDVHITHHFGARFQTDVTTVPSCCTSSGGTTNTNPGTWNRYAFGGTWRF